jgi:hypothetical protein
LRPSQIARSSDSPIARIKVQFANLGNPALRQSDFTTPDTDGGAGGIQLLRHRLAQAAHGDNG